MIVELRVTFADSESIAERIAILFILSIANDIAMVFREVLQYF